MCAVKDNANVNHNSNICTQFLTTFSNQQLWLSGKSRALRKRGSEVLAPVIHNVFHYSVSLVNDNAIVIVKGDANSKWWQAFLKFQNVCCQGQCLCQSQFQHLYTIFCYLFQLAAVDRVELKREKVWRF